MEVLYKSTRSNIAPVKASQAILKGLSEDGGLFVPDHIPALDKSLSELSKMTGYSQAKVSRCEQKILCKLRNYHKAS